MVIFSFCLSEDGAPFGMAVTLSDPRYMGLSKEYSPELLERVSVGQVRDRRLALRPSASILVFSIVMA